MMKSRWLLFSFLFIHLSCGTLSHRIVSDFAPAAARLKEGADLEEEVRRLVRPVIEKEDMDSVVVGILTPDGRQHLFSFAAEKKEAVPVNGIFQTGSVSKVVIAAVLAVLVNEGVLRYDHTVRELLPPEVPVDPSIGRITLDELITHTSGLPRSGRGFIPFWQFLRYLFTGRNLYGYLDRDYLAVYLRTEKVRVKNKGTYHYSNVGAGLLVYLMETRTGTSFAKLAEEKIFEPLGMTDTAYSLSPEQKARLVQGHAGHQPLFVRRGRPLEPWHMGDPMRYAGGLYSTAGDLLNLAGAQFGFAPDRLTDSLETTRKIQLESEEGGVALGWMAERFEAPRAVLFYKHGMVAGYSAYLGFNAETKTAVAVLAGTFNWDDRIGHNLLLRLSAAAAK